MIAEILTERKRHSSMIDGVTIDYALTGGEEEEVIMRTVIGPLEGRRNTDALLEEALAGNFLWQGTNGATLSIDGEGRLMLTDRRSLLDFGDEDGEFVLENEFFRTAAEWRGRLAKCEIENGEADEWKIKV